MVFPIVTQSLAHVNRAKKGKEPQNPLRLLYVLSDKGACPDRWKTIADMGEKYRKLDQVAIRFLWKAGVTLPAPPYGCMIAYPVENVKFTVLKGVFHIFDCINFFDIFYEYF